MIVNDIFLYFRMIIYPLTALGMAMAIIMNSDQPHRKPLVAAMSAGIVFIMALFVVETAMIISPELHTLLNTIILTPAIFLAAIAVWIYVFRSSKHFPCTRRSHDI